MANIIPLKLVDVGGGSGQLREYASGDIIPAEYLPPSSSLAGQANQYDITAGRALLTTAFGFPTNPATITANIDNRALIPLGTVICDANTAGTKPTGAGFLTTTEHGPTLAVHQEWVEITGATTNIRRFYRDSYAFQGFNGWKQYANTADIPTATSQLTNNSGYITAAAVPTATSQLTNNSGFITAASVPTKTSQLANDSGFVTSAQAGAPGPWNALAPYLAGGITPFGGTPGFRNNNGMIEFRGGILCAGGFGGTYDILFTLPAGFRPPYLEQNVLVLYPKSNSGNPIGTTYTDSTGLTYWNNGTGSAANTAIFLDQMRIAVGY